MALVYAAVRLLEAHGLRRQRSWAERAALVSDCIYLPMEGFELIERFTWIRVGALIADLRVVGFMASVGFRSRRAEPPEPAMPAPVLS